MHAAGMQGALADVTRLLKGQTPVGIFPGLLPPSLLAARALSRKILPPSLGRIGDLEVRLARTGAEVRGAQALRYGVFFEEMSAIPRMGAQFLRRDVDAYDQICDHLLVIDHALPPAKPFGVARPTIVGTYRLLRQDVAEFAQGFYSQHEFDLGPLVARHPDLKFLELGRSCVLPPYRNKRTVELLWHGIWAYVLAHGIDCMIGCASFEGTNPDALALPLSFLHHNARADEEWSVSAKVSRHVQMNRLPASAIDMKRALHVLPPLLKGYLRLGAKVGDGAVVDRAFGTTDVFIVLPRQAISERYISHFGADAGRYAA